MNDKNKGSFESDAAKLGGSLRVDPSYTEGCRMIFEVPFGLPEEI